MARLTPANTLFLLCDMQEAFVNSIAHMPAIQEGCLRLVRAANIMNIPLVVSEQYPKALGRTVAVLRKELTATQPVFEKTRFSMLTEELLGSGTLNPAATPNVVLFGIETHVCVQQTALDLAARQFNVFVVADAVASRTAFHRRTALNHLKQRGSFVTSVEAVLFELLADSKHGQFKEVQALIKTTVPDVDALL